MPLTHTDIEGTLTIDSIDMENQYGAWGICGDAQGRGGLVHLWAGFAVRGEDRLIPLTPGVIAYPRRMTVTRHDLRLLVVGDVDGETGDPFLDPIVGLQTNIEYLRDNVIEPVVSATGTREAELTMPDLTVRVANIHVLGLVVQNYQLGMCGALAITTLQISIPGGRFVGSES